MRYLIVLLLLVSSAYAQTPETQYVDAGAGCTGNDGTVGNPYCNCSEFDAQLRNLVSEDKVLTVQFTGTLTGTCNISSGWTTDATRKIILSGLDLQSTTYGTVMVIDGEFVDVIDSTIGKMGAGTVKNFINIIETATVRFLRNKVFYGPSWTNDGGGFGIQILGNFVSQNTMYYNLAGSPVTVGLFSSKTYQFLNNSFGSSTAGALSIAVDSGSTGTIIDIKNNIFAGCGGTCYSVTPGSATLTTATNSTSDTSSPQAGLRSITVSFVSSTDLHLDPAETDVDDEGTDLSSAHSFSDDYDGDTRTVSWSIGAHELDAGTPTPTPTATPTPTPTPTPEPTAASRKGQRCLANRKGQCGRNFRF